MTLNVGTKSRTSYHRSPGGERRRKRKCSIIFLERTRKGHHQNQNRFKGNVEESSERWGGARMGFSEHIDTILNRTELNWWFFFTSILPCPLTVICWWSLIKYSGSKTCQTQATNIIMGFSRIKLLTTKPLCSVWL